MFDSAITIKLPVLILLLIGTAVVTGFTTYQITHVSQSSVICLPTKIDPPIHKSHIKPSNLPEGDGMHF